MSAAPNRLGGRSSVSAVMTLGCVFALACNTVLGIDEAQLDPARTTAPSMGGQTSSAIIPATYVPAAGCTAPSADCTTCLEACAPGLLNSCLDNADCRDALDRHRICLGADCKANDLGGWSGCTETNPILDSDLIGCAVNDCSQVCAGSPLVDMCELLCACKEDHCMSTPNCIAECTALGSDRRLAYCRFKHCQIADSPTSFHCRHADGIDQCTVATIVANECPEAASVGFPCLNGPDDCCTGVCISQVCAE